MTDYEFYKSQGICVQCKQEKAAPNRVRCEVCLVQNLSTQENRRKKGAYKYSNTGYSKKLREKRKSEGLCIWCGKPLCSKSKCYCIDCRIKNQKNNNARKNGIERSERESYGLCYICGETAMEGKNTCKDCYERCRNNLQLANNSKSTKDRRDAIRKQNRLIFKN